MVVVAGPASVLIAASVPTAVNRPSAIATACAIENAASTVMMWPLTRIVSGGRATGCARAIDPMLRMRRATRRTEGSFGEHIIITPDGTAEAVPYDCAVPSLPVRVIRGTLGSVTMADMTTDLLTTFSN